MVTWYVYTVIVAIDGKRVDTVTKEECGKLWDLIGAYWPNSARLSDRKTMVAYWYALAPYDYGDCKNAVIAHARRKGSYFPDVPDITGALSPIDAAGVVETEEPVESWDRPWDVDDAAELIGLWARLHGMKPPVCDTVEEYFAWRRKALETQREASA